MLPSILICLCAFDPERVSCNIRPQSAEAVTSVPHPPSPLYTARRQDLSALGPTGLPTWLGTNPLSPRWGLPPGGSSSRWGPLRPIPPRSPPRACTSFFYDSLDKPKPNKDVKSHVSRERPYSALSRRSLSFHHVACHIDGVEAAVGTITLSDYDADRRSGSCENKCLRVATFYRVMHMRERSRRAGRMREMRRLFSGWAASFLTHTRQVAMQAAHEARAAVDRTGRREYVIAARVRGCT